MLELSRAVQRVTVSQVANIFLLESSLCFRYRRFEFSNKQIPFLFKKTASQLHSPCP